MLDNQTMASDDVDIEAEEGLGEEVIADQGAEDESLEISIEGEEPEADADAEIEPELSDPGRRALQAARKAAKDAAAEARAAKAELAAERALKAAPIEDDAQIERPTIEGCGYNTEVYDSKLREYFTAESKVEAKKQARIAEARAADDDYQARLGSYVTGKTALRAADMDTAESVVRSTLSIEQQNVLIRNSDNPAQVVLALGRSKKALADLAGVKDIDRFAFQLAKLEGKITVTTKAPPPPESKLQGGISAGARTSFTSQLDAAEKEAERTGDRSKVVAIKRQMKAAGVKS